MKSEQNLKYKSPVSVYTDGACRNNPGKGGWGVFIVDALNNKFNLSGAEKITTNNRMELTAAIKALEEFSVNDKINLYTDSKYLKQGITEWIISWKKKNWINSHKKPVKNKDLWERLDYLNEKLNVNWHWVRGHSGHFGNEKADYLANKAIK